MRRSQIGAVALAAALLAAPAAADWLVARDGGRVETRGVWKVKGKLVVFTRADGQLASLRLADVDLAASERATREAVEAEERVRTAEPVPVEEPREAKWVLTDADLKHSAPRAAAPAEKAGEEPKVEEVDAAGRPRVAVALEGWERKNLRDGLEIAGTLRNPGDEIAAEVGVTVRLLDETGSLVATGEGRIATPAIGPGATAGFRATFPGVFTFAEAKFEVRGFGLRIKAAEPPKEGEANP